MTNKVSKSKSAVRAAREAVKASQKEVLERAARNAEDLAVFFSSRERLDAVDEWLDTKIAGLKEQADGKRAEHRRTAGLAVIALRDRGETLRDIARLTGVGEKALREWIRFAESSVADDATNDEQPQGGAVPEGSSVRDGADASAGRAMAAPAGPVVGAPDQTWPATG
ncbi:hypothetical protein MI149_30120 (plasmid) [Mycolicibacterium crocinum]|uniref:Transposase n=1 Tax=Mycolicibacterium crocinum TaxID=388459 RepID=A0ABY3TTI1_9MYCO|nr:hypothetical protein [Mycolicibacterium crocinum]ULN44753.1 hypothetical protein MI149_30120 [Mycolicibacterium crocinum]